MIWRRVNVKHGFLLLTEKSFCKERSGEFLQVNQRVHHKIENSSFKAVELAFFVYDWLRVCVCSFLVIDTSKI